MIAAIDPSMVAGLGDQWQTPDVTQLPGADFQDPCDRGRSARVGGDAGGFGKLLADQIGKLSELQTNAAVQGQALADGTASDPVDRRHGRREGADGDAVRRSAPHERRRSPHRDLPHPDLISPSL